MIDLVIVVEGETDVPFIKYYFNLNIEINELQIFELTDDSFIKTGSKDRLHEHSKTIEKAIFEGKQVIILFDADSDYEASLNNINKQLNQALPIFLFPDNKNIGTLETLLCQIVPEDHKIIFSCYDEYSKCIISLNKYPKLKDKGKILSYVEIVTPLNKAISLSQIKNYNKEYWNLESDYLLPLKTFLEKHK